MHAADDIVNRAGLSCYLVGGAVRDELLGREVKERDWVVVGASAEEMTAAGFTPVGKDFPVFLHPQTHEEYALARTERKDGHGYHGFTVYADRSVTLEEDLVRRDLTVNAMAKDAHGKIIDPFDGQHDLEKRQLRHVSEAFQEDPVRILRVARFSARYHALGFQVHSDTMALMRRMVEQGEADHLVAERVWQETAKALTEDHPQIYLQVLRDCGALQRLFPEIDCLFGVPQPERWHPEIDTGIHTLMVLEQAARLTADPVVRFASLVHDLGKCRTPPEKWPSHHGHEAGGVPCIKAMCERLRIPNAFRDLSNIVARYHLHVHKVTELRNDTIVKTLNNLDAWRRPERFEDFLTACEADARGRTGFETRPYPQADHFRAAFQAAKVVDVQDVIKDGFSGKAIADELQKRRIQALADQRDF